MRKHCRSAGGGSVKAGALLIALLIASPARADNVARWRLLIAEASQRFGIPAHWIERVMRAESGGRTEQGGRPIRSRMGAIGLMQIMPETWAAMRDAHRLGDDPDDPRANILAGTAYLRLMYDRFGYPGLFAAYNAGPARYAAHLATGARLPGETVAFLAAVSGRSGLPKPSSPPPRQRLFAVRHDTPGHPPSKPAAAPPHALFALRVTAP
ncbi:lytic transglycosylase domain-containing protein [Sphingomonas gilva]|uniref:Lytic transglycosylase domain-containing protein n=1 Tax=Sphingomonas gilva TaxID=2305907 RepID=A0A396S442_9SPHN|nr:lytic transglycosylase domain-containing protein [Sphingomonas gilva]RHW18185.1 lytic transglycosylase domain-containing protein [Sphingomonas gilva]